MARATTTEEDIHFAEELVRQLARRTYTYMPGWNTESLQADYSWVLEWVAENFAPEDVFPEDELGHAFHDARRGGL